KFDLFVGERFDDVVKRAVLHAFHGGFDAAEAGCDDAERFLLALLNRLEQFGAVAIGQTDIEENEIEIVLAEQFGGGGDGGDGGDIVAPAAQALFEVIANDQIVFQNNNFFDGHRSAWDVAFVNVGDVAGLLDGGSGEVTRRHETPAQKRLLILTFKQQQLHQKVLNGLKQHFYF